MLIIVVIVAIAAILAIAASRPNEMRIQRSAVIGAPPGKIFPLVADFKHWAAWSPYEKLDPNMSKTVSGAPSGKGAVYEWDGNNKAGKGRMEITEAVPPERLHMKLDFDRPMRASNVAEFTFVPSAQSTTVTWLMLARTPFIGKVMGVFVNMDRLIGRDFEVGLANLKAIAER